MLCEVCGSTKSSTIKSVAADFHGQFRYLVKVRKCGECGHNFKTVELPALSVPFANPALLSAIRQLIKASRDTLRMAEATELFLLNEAKDG